MFKYSCKAFDKNGDLVFSAIVPMDNLFQFLDHYKDEFTIKAYIIDAENSEI